MLSVGLSRERGLLLDIDAFLRNVDLIVLIDFKYLVLSYFFRDPVGLVGALKGYNLLSYVCSALDI